MIGAQRFDLFHRISRNLGHFLDAVLLRGDYAGVPQQTLGGHRIFLHAVDQRCDPSTKRVPPVPLQTRRSEYRSNDSFSEVVKIEWFARVSADGRMATEAA
jgi:hypothetical protein